MCIYIFGGLEDPTSQYTITFGWSENYNRNNYSSLTAAVINLTEVHGKYKVLSNSPARTIRKE